MIAHEKRDKMGQNASGKRILAPAAGRVKQNRGDQARFGL
jgi:hypothetical protein